VLARLIVVVGRKDLLDDVPIIAMREYDNVDYRYTSSDRDNQNALTFLSGFLGFRPDTKSLEFDLNFFSGGIGVDDKLAFSCSVSQEEMAVTVRKLQLISPEEALSDPACGEEFAWLVKHEGGAILVRKSSSRFINDNRKPFQSLCTEEIDILFASESDVNAWTAVWIWDGRLNCLYANQG
jgi:hypothetical protein